MKTITMDYDLYLKEIEDLKSKSFDEGFTEGSFDCARQFEEFFRNPETIKDEIDYYESKNNLSPYQLRLLELLLLLKQYGIQA